MGDQAAGRFVEWWKSVRTTNSIERRFREVRRRTRTMGEWFRIPLDNRILSHTIAHISERGNYENYA